MLFKEINQKFTEKVAEFIQNGYRINSATMAGHQGEISKVDFTDGENIYRVLLDSKYTHDDESYLFGTTVVRLIVGKSTDMVLPDRDDTFGTVWNDHLKVISCEEFYEISNGRDRVSDEKFYGTKDEAKAAAQIRSERRNNHPSGCATKENITSEQTVNIVLPFVKRMRNGKRVERKQVEVWKTTCTNGSHYYTVHYFKDAYKLA